MKVELSSCELAKKQIEAQGFIVGQNGLEVYPKKVSYIVNARLSGSNKTVKSYSLFCSFFLTFVP